MYVVELFHAIVKYSRFDESIQEWMKLDSSIPALVNLQPFFQHPLSEVIFHRLKQISRRLSREDDSDDDNRGISSSGMIIMPSLDTVSKAIELCENTQPASMQLVGTIQTLSKTLTPRPDSIVCPAIDFLYSPTPCDSSPYCCL